MAFLVAFRCCLIMYTCSVSIIAENKLVMVVVVVLGTESAHKSLILL